MNAISPRRMTSAFPKTEIVERHADLAADLARAGWLIRRRAWRHLKTEFAGHKFVPLAALSGAIADAALFMPADLLWPAMIIVAAPVERREMVADMLVVFGAADG